VFESQDVDNQGAGTIRRSYSAAKTL